MLHPRPAPVLLADGLKELATILKALIDGWPPGTPLADHLRDVLKANQKPITKALVAAGASGGAAAAGTIWAATLGPLAKFGFWLGIVVMPAWVPALGALAAGTAVLGGAALAWSKLGKGQQQKAVLLGLNIQSILARASSDSSHALEDIADDAARRGLNRKEIESGLSVKSIEELNHQTGLPAEVLRVEMLAAWVFVVGKLGVDAAVERTWDRLAVRLGVQDPGALKKQAVDAVAEGTAQAEAVFEMSHVLMGDLDNRAEQILRDVLAIDPSEQARQRREKTMNVVRTVASVAIKVAPLALPLVGKHKALLSAFVFALRHLWQNGEPSVSKLASAHRKASELGASLGLDTTALEGELDGLARTFAEQARPLQH